MPTIISHPQPSIYETTVAVRGETPVTHRTVEAIATRPKWQPPTYDLDAAWRHICDRQFQRSNVSRKTRRKAGR